MGILAFFVGGTTAKALIDSINRDLPATNQILPSTMHGHYGWFPTMAAEPGKDGGILVQPSLGTKGLLTAFIAALFRYMFIRSAKKQCDDSHTDEVPHRYFHKSLKTGFHSQFPIVSLCMHLNWIS